MKDFKIIEYESETERLDNRTNKFIAVTEDADSGETGIANIIISGNDRVYVWAYTDLTFKGYTREIKELVDYLCDKWSNVIGVQLEIKNNKTGGKKYYEWERQL